MSTFKKKLTAFTAMLAFLSISGVASFAALPGDVLGQTGNVGITDRGSGRTDVDIVNGGNGAVGQVDWKDFNVGAGNQVNFGFSGLSQTIINRVLGGNRSDIFGKLTNSCVGDGSCSSWAATSKVILINPAGVLFGAGSTVDLNSFTVSTFDINGAKNLKGMDEPTKTNYQLNVLNKFSPVDSVNGKDAHGGEITFDSHYTGEFAKAYQENGKTFTPHQGLVELNGTKFGHFDGAGNYVDANPNKSIAIVSDNIKYKDSVLRTGDNFNYMTQNSNSTFSNVRLITADGVTFDYIANGYADTYKVAEDQSNVVRNIDINNSGLAKDEAAIRSGDVHILNQSNADGSNIKIANSVVKGVKLVNRENGDIMIVGSKDVTIDNSRLQTLNSETVAEAHDNVAKQEANTNSQKGGQIYVHSGKNLTIGNSTIDSAASTGTGEKAGDIDLYSDGNSTITNTKVLSQGNARLLASGQNNITGSIVQAANTLDASKEKNIEISGGSGVKLHNTVVSSSNDVDIRSTYGDNSVAGDIVISSDLDKQGKNQTLIIANGDLSIQGSDTRLDNAALAYEQIHFYNDGTTGTNNVTVANNTTFSPIEYTESGKRVGADITLETNGDFTLENATMKRSTYALNWTKDAQGRVIDDGSAKGPEYKIALNTQADAHDINVKSTQGNVTVKSNSNVHATNDLNLTANNGTVSTQGSTLKADRNATLTGKDVKVAGASTVTAGNDATLKATNTASVEGSTVKADNNANITGKDVKVAGASTVTAGNDATLKATNTASVEGSTVKADNNANITGKDVKVIADNNNDSTVTAGNDANLKATNDVTINAKKKQGKDTVKAGHDVNIEATGGSLHITDNAKITGDNNVNMKSKNTVKFGEQGSDANIDNTVKAKAGKNMLVQSTSGNIEAEKTTMAELEYGNRLTFNAAKKNLFTSKDSLKSVNVDYIAGEENSFTTKGDIQFVDSKFKSAKNNVNSGDDVILNGLTIEAQDAQHPERTVTDIQAKGNITTKDITGTTAADRAAKTHKYPQSVNVEKQTLDFSQEANPQDTLDVGNTKFKASTQARKNEGQLDTKGSMDLVVKNAGNKNAGIELKAENVGGWDGASDVNEGPEIHIDAEDDQLAVSKMVTDKLTTHAEDRMLASDVDLTEDELKGLPADTPHKGYIEVRDYMGYNQDNDFTKQPDDFSYESSYVPGKHHNEDGTDTDINKKHIVDFGTGDDDQSDEFIFVYDRPVDCPPVPEIDRVDNADSLIAQQKLPREQVEISKTSRVSDNTVDQTSNIMSAAAKVDLANNAEADEDKDSDDDE